MAIKDTFPNLPGFVAQIQDNGLQIKTPQQTLTKSVLLLGVATDGPSNTPIQVQSIADAERLYGVTLPATSIVNQPAVQKSLTRGIYEAFQAGCSDIRLCRVGGTAASLTLADTSAGNSIILTAGYAGVKYNAITASVAVPAGTASGTVTITTADGIPHPISYTAGTLVGDLVNAINAANLNIQASTGATAVQTAATGLTVLAATAFTGGADGTVVTDAQYSDALSAAYAQLENYGTDIAVPLGAYLQPTMGLDATGNATVVNANSGDTVFFGQNLAQFCARVSVRTKSSFGVIAIAPLAVPTFLAVNKRASQLSGTAYTFQYAGGYSPAAGPKSGAALDSTGNIFDIGYLLNIVAGPDLIVNNPNFGTYVTDGAATYAGRICALVPHSATTNKPVPGAIGLAYTFGATVLDNITGQRFVSFFNNAGSVRTVADQTYSLPNHDFTKLSTLRVAYAAMEAVRNATQSFIGEASNPAAYNAMGTAIDTALKALKDAGALLDFSFNIAATAQNQIDGQVSVTLVLVPALQIRKIVVTISLKPAGTN